LTKLKLLIKQKEPPPRKSKACLRLADNTLLMSVSAGGLREISARMGKGALYVASLRCMTHLASALKRIKQERTL